MSAPPKANKPRAAKPFTGGVSVVGPGRWGSTLYAALRAESGLATVQLVGRAKSKAGVFSFELAHFDAELIWLCVPDEAIAGVVARVVKKRPDMRGQVVVHSSGVWSSAMLERAARAGAQTASVHPLMTFPTRRPVSLAGVPFAVEAPAGLAARLDALVRRIGGRPFALPAKGKALYHAAAVMASPLLVSLAASARTTAMRAGLSNKEADTLLEPIMTATLRNFFKGGAAQSFSGPFARGDAQTVSLHLAALQAHPFEQAVYRALAEHALQVLPVAKRSALKKALATKANILK